MGKGLLRVDLTLCYHNHDRINETAIFYDLGNQAIVYFRGMDDVAATSIKGNLELRLEDAARNILTVSNPLAQVMLHDYSVLDEEKCSAAETLMVAAYYQKQKFLHDKQKLKKAISETI
jgi:hypothetical protein